MGKVYWITGLSGAGKTTIGRLFFENRKAENTATVFLDGDTLRRVFGDDLGYTEEDRRKCAMRYSRLCALLSSQGIDVVICTISMFHAVREWNREHIPGYCEIYIRVPMEVLRQRDQKGLYSGKTSEKEKDLVGVDIQFEEPVSPDIVLDNDGTISPEKQVENLWNRLL